MKCKDSNNDFAYHWFFHNHKVHLPISRMFNQILFIVFRIPFFIWFQASNNKNNTELLWANEKIRVKGKRSSLHFYLHWWMWGLFKLLYNSGYHTQVFFQLLEIGPKIQLNFKFCLFCFHLRHFFNQSNTSFLLIHFIYFSS